MFRTVISGVLVFVGSQLALELVINPCVERRKLERRIRYAVVYYANLLTNPFVIDNANRKEGFEQYARSSRPAMETELRSLGAEMATYRGRGAEEIYRSLIFLSNNTWAYSDRAGEIGQWNNETIEEIRKLLESHNKNKK